MPTTLILNHSGLPPVRHRVGHHLRRRFTSRHRHRAACAIAPPPLRLSGTSTLPPLHRPLSRRSFSAVWQPVPAPVRRSQGASSISSTFHFFTPLRFTRRATGPGHSDFPPFRHSGHALFTFHSGWRRSAGLAIAFRHAIFSYSRFNSGQCHRTAPFQLLFIMLGVPGANSCADSSAAALLMLRHCPQAIWHIIVSRRDRLSAYWRVLASARVPGILLSRFNPRVSNSPAGYSAALFTRLATASPGIVVLQAGPARQFIMQAIYLSGACYLRGF